MSQPCLLSCSQPKTSATPGLFPTCRTPCLSRCPGSRSHKAHTAPGWSHMPTSSFGGFLPFQNSSHVSPVFARHLLSLSCRRLPFPEQSRLYLLALLLAPNPPSRPPDSFPVCLSGQCPPCLKRPGGNSPAWIPSFFPALLFQSSPCGLLVSSLQLGDPASHHPLLHCPLGPLASLLSPPSGSLHYNKRDVSGTEVSSLSIVPLPCLPVFCLSFCALHHHNPHLLQAPIISPCRVHS